MNRESLAASLSRYSSPFPEESVFVKRFLELLEHRDAFQRNHLPGHFTASAWIVDPAKQFILLTHHAKLNKWLQPGGHADGDENILRVALKEAREETGISHFRVLKDGIFDIDIHTIPAGRTFRSICTTISVSFLRRIRGMRYRLRKNHTTWPGYRQVKYRLFQAETHRSSG